MSHKLLWNRLLPTMAAAILVVTTAGPALADPPAGTTPDVTNAVGVGSETTQYLMNQLATDHDATRPEHWYSWDAVNPFTLTIGGDITTKTGCGAITRPDGSSAGIAALDANAQPAGGTTNYCLDYARSSRGRISTDPPFAPGGVAFVSLAGDAVTWASRDAASGGTDAPKNLTAAQLAAIYECTITNWKQVGGKNASIKAFLPQTSSGTRQFFLTALGGGTPITPGPCVRDAKNTLEENEGINPVLNSAETIFIYSVGAFLAQMYHSAACTKHNCAPVSNPGTQPCKPAKGQNKFGCDETGVLQLNTLDKSQPTRPWPLTSTTTTATINPSYDLTFQRTLYDVVRYDPNTADHVPGAESRAPGGLNLDFIFGAGGWICQAPQAITDIKDYGFLPAWRLSSCGATG